MERNLEPRPRERERDLVGRTDQVEKSLTLTFFAYLLTLRLERSTRSFRGLIGEERRDGEQGNGLAQTLSLSVGSGSEAYPSIPQCGEILIMRYYDKRRTIHPY